MKNREKNKTIPSKTKPFQDQNRNYLASCGWRMTLVVFTAELQRGDSHKKNSSPNYPWQSSYLPLGVFPTTCSRTFKSGFIARISTSIILHVLLKDYRITWQQITIANSFKNDKTTVKFQSIGEFVWRRLGGNGWVVCKHGGYYHLKYWC